ncbi:transposase [Candidatus Pantoea symbiotica]|jgi:transposase|uniref:Transposase n=1 Tax=Candidatus Pantoea symbiotica TaxID=1884370 RepID=A0A1I3ZGS5_9GAMM|nr:transposase [Pantoea symbiotica]SFU93747.1 transposase [Pantoea sp. YR525]
MSAVKQVVDRGHSIASVATRLDITTRSLYAWVKKYGSDSSANKIQSDAQSEIRRFTLPVHGQYMLLTVIKISVP